ncbi:MAG: ParM/StbA family protein [Cyanobacteria bacterium J06621_12]
MNDNSVESKPKPKSVLKLVFDPGTSLSKILYVVDEKAVKWMTMGAEYLTLRPESAEELPISNGMGKPEDNAWVRLAKKSECHAVGFVASNYRGTSSIKKLKHESLTFKILATVGAIAQREKLGNNLELELGILLPYNEYLLSKDWLAELKAALASFYFQNQRFKVKLTRYSCKPEGYGIAKYSSECSGASYFSEGNTAIIMLGYRNTSCLFFRRGSVSKPESGTADLGFYTLLDKLISKAPGLSRSDILKAIENKFEESYGRASNNQTYFNYKELSSVIDFTSLVKADSVEALQKKSEKLKQSYNISLDEYWTLLENWLYELLPRRGEIDGFVLAGGSSDLLYSRFRNYTIALGVQSFENSASDELKKYLLYGKDPQKERFMRESLAKRFADAWGFFVSFTKYDLSQILDRNTGEVISDGE